MAAIAAGGRIAGRQRWQDRRALVVMVISHAVQHFYVGGLAITYPLVVTTFHVSYGVLGVVLTAAGLLGGLLQGAAGLVRRVSARAVLTAQNITLAAATALGAVAPGFAVFGVARCLGSAVSWPQHPVGSAYLSDRFPDRRGAALSWHTVGGSLGTVAVPLITSAVIATSGWRWALAALAALIAAGGLFVGLTLPREPRHEHAGAPSAAEKAAPGPRLWPILLRRRVLLVLAASTIAAGGRGLGTISAYLPAYLKSDLHLGQIQIGVVFTTVMAASIAGPVLAGHLADRLGRNRLLVGAYLGGAEALAAYPFARRGMAALQLTGIAVGLLAYPDTPLLQAVFADSIGQAHARAAFGAFFAIAYGVGALWLAVLGWVIDTFGFTTAFLIMAGSFVIAAAMVLLAGSQRPGDGPAAQPAAD